MTFGAFLELVEVPDRLSILVGWFDWVSREHLAWAALGVGLVWTVLANLDLVARFLPARAREWLWRNRNVSLARFVHFERPCAILNRPRAIGFSFRVFNGNQRRVTFRVDGRLLHYGDRKIPSEMVTITAPPEGIPSATHRELEVVVTLRSPFDEEVERDRAVGKLKPISLSEFVLMVLDDAGNAERIRLPRAISLFRAESEWLAGREFGLHEAEDKILHIVEGRASL